MKVVEIRTRQAKVNDDTVAMLEQWLADAKAGRITSAALAGTHADGTVTVGWSSTEAAPTLAGAIARLAHRYNIELDYNLELDDDRAF